MTAAFKTFVAGAVAAAAFVAVPALAMPVGAAGSQGDIVKVSGWASRAQGYSHTYRQTYGYNPREGYEEEAYGSQGYGGFPGAFGDDGRGAPQPYGYGDGYNAY